MKSREEVDTERFSRALANLRQEVAAVLEHAPDLMEINSLEEIPGEKSKVIEEWLWRILLYGEYYVEKVKSDLNTPLLTVKNRDKNYAFYANEYPTFIEKVRELIGASNIPSTEAFERSFEEEFYLYDDYYGEFIWNDQTLDEYELHVKTRYVLNSVRRHNRTGRTDAPILDGDEKIKDSFVVAVEAVEYVANCHHFIFNRFCEVVDSNADIPELALQKEIFDEDTRKRLGFHRDCFDYDPPEPYRYEKIIKNCNLVAERFWFKPDTWLANERVISPVTVARDLEKIPRPIKERIGEIHQSFVFSNWMSAIALSRCLLECALIDRKSLLEKRLGRKIDIRVNSMRAKTIRELAEISGEAFPELKESMDIVIDYGNYVMHPFQRTIPGKNIAKHCLEEISKIIGTLYSVNS